MQDEKHAPSSGAGSGFEIVKQYADNEMYCVGLSLSLSLPDWCEFSTQPFYPQLLEYLRNLEIRGSKDSPVEGQD